METNGIEVKHGLEGDSDLQFLSQGGDLLKVRSTSWKKTRYFRLLEDCKTMWHESKKTFRANQTFSLDSIKEVRMGRQTEGLKKHTEEHVEGRCFSIIFKGHRKNLDLIASSEEEAKQWVNSLQKIISNLNNLSYQEKKEHCLYKADKNKDDKLTQEELKNFLQLINLDVDDDYAEMLFKECDKSNSGYLSGKEIEHFYDLLTHREEIEVIYGSYAKTSGFMSADNLMEFLMNEQKEKATVADAHKIIEKHEPDEKVKVKKMLSKDGFLMYLHHPQSMILNPKHKEVYQDMSQPLNHYFISSSHNTYLLEDQLKGPSSTEAYVRALMKGCRCVELDCWDGSDNEPQIYHGHTLTSKILFKDVIKAIKEYAFKTSDYPVILSLENHCSVEQQAVMAHHLKSILGSALVTSPLGDVMPTNFPSPEELKGKFLIKGKRLNKLETSFVTEDAVGEDTDVTEEEESGDEDVNEQKEQEKSKQKKKLKLAKELSNMVIYCKSVHFHGFEEARKNQSFYEMSSFKEAKAMKLAEESANAYIHHNIEKLSRIYPAGFRTDSSNYNPVPLWNTGCQMVALNFQTWCPEMDINQGRFMVNGKSGYILKPAYLRDKATEFDPITLTRGQWLQYKKLHVMVISAQQLPKVNKKKSSIVDPLIKVEVCGVPADAAVEETSTVENNGFNPEWNENFQFEVYVPELALLRFIVEDHDSTSDNEFIAQYTLPVNSLKMGYRHVPLLNKNGDVLPSAGLFVHIMVLEAE